MTLRAALLTLPLIAAACGAKLAGPGEPCQTTADCQDGLECHLHDGERECEEPHDDDDDTDTDHTDEA